MVDFDVNARATLNLLECVRKHAGDSVLFLLQPIKCTGTGRTGRIITKPQRAGVRSMKLRSNGFDESLSVDQCLHSLFGSSKLSADVMVQEYAMILRYQDRYISWRCLTGPHHSGAELHGFLSYLVKCCVVGKPYTIYGYKGKQVKDNIHSEDLLAAFWEFTQAPKIGKSTISGWYTIELLHIRSH